MDVYEKAMQRKKQLEADLRQVEHFIRMYDELAGPQPIPIQKVQESQQPKQQVTLLELAASIGQVVNGVANATKKMKIEFGVLSLLKEHQPQSTEDLLRGLEKMSVEVGGTNPIVNLASYLSKSDKFEMRRKEGGWFIAENKDTHQILAAHQST